MMQGKKGEVKNPKQHASAGVSDSPPLSPPFPAYVASGHHVKITSTSAHGTEEHHVIKVRESGRRRRRRRRSARGV